MSVVPTSPNTEATAKLWLLNDRITSLREWGTTDERWLPTDDNAVVTIGRDPPVSVSGHAAIRFDRPGISRVHVVMQRIGSYWQLYDHRSASGVYVNGVPCLVGQLLPGDVMSLDDLCLVATSSRVRAIRRLWARFLTTGDSATARARVDEAVWASTQFAGLGGSLVVRGRIGERLARRLHDLARGEDRPFVALQHRERPQRMDEIRALIERATRGTLFLRDHQLDAESQRLLLHEIAERKRSVRIIFAAEGGSDVWRECGYLGARSIVDVPLVADRADEIAALVRDLVRDHAIAMSACTEVLRPSDWERLARWDWDDHDEMEDVTLKLVALRHHRKPARAARALGLSVSWFCQWMLRYGIEK